MNEVKTIECKCTKSYYSIDPTANNLICEVKGIVDAKNVRIVNGVITCSSCSQVIN